MFVYFRGYSSERSPCTRTSNAVTFWRFFSRIEMTSDPVQTASAASSNSSGLMAFFPPPSVRTENPETRAVASNSVPLFHTAMASLLVGIRSPSARLAQHADQVFDDGLLAFALVRLEQALRGVRAHDHQAHLLYRRTDGGQLLDDLVAVAVAVHHLGHAAHLPLDPAQPLFDILFRRRAFDLHLQTSRTEHIL